MASLIDSLATLLDRDAKELEILEQSLVDERRALETRDHQGLQDSLTVKTRALAQLQGNSKAKTQLFAQHGLKASPTHIKAALQKVGRLDLLARWNQVNDQLDRCKALNEINGRILYRSQQSLGKILSILRGQSNQQQIYGENGRANSLGSRQLIANA